jgi:hypothetical protein
MYKFLPVKALEHLNDEQKKSLIEDFFAQDVGLSMVKLSKYGLSHYRTGLLPIIEIDLQESCINCGSTISRYKFITRTKFKNDNLPPFCFEDKDVLRMFLQPNNCDCGHLYNSNWCKCEACRIERDERDFILKEQARKKEKYESNWKKKIIKKKYDIEIACVPFGEIEHPSSKVLAFFLSEFVNKDTDLISLNSEDKIFPVNFFNENIDRLLDERILKISHLSEIDSFEFKNGEITGVYIYKVFYEFNVANISISCKKEDIRIGS